MSDTVSGNLSDPSGLSGYNGGPDAMSAAFLELAADRDAELCPELQPWVENGDWGPMLRHPLVYMIPLTMPGMANKQLAAKKEALAEAVSEENWHTAVFLHERAYRLKALIDYVTGRDEEGNPLPLIASPVEPAWALAADVWVDSENISQVNDDWRALFANGTAIWLGTDEETAAFNALPTIDTVNGPVIRAWRGGAVGDWSWTTDKKIAQFFSRRSGLPVRGHLIPVADVFGYLTRRGEAELLVKFTEFRRDLVYPVSRNEDA